MPVRIPAPRDVKPLPYGRGSDTTAPLIGAAPVRKRSPPCGGNEVIDVDDILAELAAFTGFYFCPHPCPP